MIVVKIISPGDVVKFTRERAYRAVFRQGEGGVTVKDCIFCKIGRHEARSWMVAESEHAFAILDIHPINLEQW